MINYLFKSQLINGVIVFKGKIVKIYRFQLPQRKDLLLCDFVFYDSKRRVFELFAGLHSISRISWISWKCECVSHFFSQTITTKMS